MQAGSHLPSLRLMPLRLSPFLRWPLRDSRPVAATHDRAGGVEVDVEALPERICIVNFTGERVNWGCRATSWELVRLLNRHWPGERPFALDVIPLLPHHALDREIPARHGPALRAALECPDPGPDAIALVERLSRERYLHLVDRLARADLVIFQGEGTMTGTDFPRAERLLLLPWLAVHRFGKRVISVNQTLFSADPDFTPALLATLAALEQVWVREPASLAWLRAQGFEGARLVPDTAWLTDPLEHGDLWKTLPERDFFCITGGAALARDSVATYLDAVAAIAQQTGLFPVLVCSTPLDRAIVAAAEARWAAGSFVTVPVGLVYPAVAELLGRARFLIGGRYHLSLLAAIGGTPSVLCATNTPKFAGLTGLLGVGWPIRGFVDSDGLMADALALLAQDPEERARLRARSDAVRAEVLAAYAGWHAPGGPARSRPAQGRNLPLTDAEARAFREANERIASGFPSPGADTPKAKLGGPMAILPQLAALTVYLRRGVHPQASFRCIRQLVEGNLDLVLKQLDARWLVSICDSYADFGEPLEARNALLISTFLNWERLAASYIQWAEPGRTTRRVEGPVPEENEPLWGGLVTVQLTRGDTTNNLFKRYARLLAPTPHLLAIWRELLGRMRDNDSVMAALDAPHGHLFDEDLDWMKDPRYDTAIAPWRMRWLRSRGGD